MESQLNIVALMPAIELAPDLAQTATIPSTIPSMYTPAIAPMWAASIATAKLGPITCPFGPRSGLRMSRASCSDVPAGSPATAWPPMAPTTDAVGRQKALKDPQDGNCQRQVHKVDSKLEQPFS
ncbi:uncharacterized protein LOC133844987 [Drosophila sulfurigaster albostrigata]|uniref:uncharacterized protein LOC133844987 n=1 Tax=Drosophila sulfurigaster albostrigata TaxID=89887 RepID=UPI002D219D66|nr:uncharacterized protein LOC133844987 [Drosophila sulfurigaster albostrigata]